MKMLILFFTLLMALSVGANDNKLIINNDAGGDDAMAIFVALLYEKYFEGPQLIALITGNGNTDEDNVFINNQKILNVAKRRDVPIYRGCKESLVITPQSTDSFGEDGLGNNGEVLTDPIPAQNESAVLALIDLAKKYPGKITLVTIGTLTNVALAIKLDPEFLGRLDHLYIGGGHIYSEKYPDVDFNVRMDVEAYHVVVEHATPDKVTILPTSQVKEHLTIDMDWRRNELGSVNTDVMRAQNEYEKLSLDKKHDKWDSLDPATVSLALNNISRNQTKPDFVMEYKYSKNGINLCGDKRGINTNIFVEKEEANVRIAYEFDIELYKMFLYDLFSRNEKK